MNTRRTILAKLLPALALPAILLASVTAQAATLSISNGFITSRSFTSSGWTFSMNASGVVNHQGQNYPSTIALDCEFDTGVEVLDCVGEMKINGVATDIMMAHDNDTVFWSIDASAPAAVKDIHEQWGQSAVPSVFKSAPGWSVIDWFDGANWRHFYYSTTWAETYESITGMQYGDAWQLG
ncbi:MAG: hypothetical protein KC431_08210 [Myxococcales bacterium]|nr:hypothetical protein [Myxococcales bacterium]